MYRLARSQVIVELFQRRKETVDFLIPRQRCRIAPLAFADCDCERPIHKVADVSEDLSWPTHARIHRKFCKTLRRAADRFTSAISQRGQSMTQQFAFRIGSG